MDQKRILWIVAASGLFLLVVVGVALFLSAPVTQSQQSLGSLQAKGNTWIKGEVKVPETNSAQNIENPETSILTDTKESQLVATNTENQPLNVDSVTIIAGSTTVYTNEKDTPTEKEVPTEKTTTISINTVNKETPVSTPVKTSTVTTNTSSSSSTKSTVTTKNQDDCEETPKTTSTATTSTSSNRNSSSQTVTQSAPIADQYWVQVASFTGKKNAEDARAALLEEKINSEIFTYKDSKGIIYYRLRVGPYTTKSEAEYWHSRIKLIEQFAGTSSYVVNSTGKAQN